MKVLLYTEGEKLFSKSGLGKAIQHQMRALEYENIEYTTDVQDHYDIVHINFYGPNSFALAKIAKVKGKKVVYHAHSTEEDFKNSFLFSNLLSPIFKWWICKCYRLGDYIITPTEYSKKILETYNLNRPIKTISNGINMDFFKKNEELGKKFRKDFSFEEDDKIVMGVGLYLERKGILDFVELAKRCPDYEFIWFGYLDLNLVPKKIRDAVNTKLPNLHFPGYVEPEVLKSAYSGADIYIFPTFEETEGIPILEAFTSKIDTIIRDIPIFDWVKDKKEVYKAKDVDEFEILINKIINKKLPSLTDEAYKLVKQFEIKNIGEKLVNIYKEILEEKNDE